MKTKAESSRAVCLEVMTSCSWLQEGERLSRRGATCRNRNVNISCESVNADNVRVRNAKGECAYALRKAMYRVLGQCDAWMHVLGACCVDVSGPVTNRIRGRIERVKHAPD